MGLICILSCSSNNSSSNDDDELSLSLSGECYSCTQSIGTGDTCGTEMISGTATIFSFVQNGDEVVVGLDDDIDLTGTFVDGILSASNSQAVLSGSGCDMRFTNILLSATIDSQDEIDSGWEGTFSYDLALSTEEACDDFSFETCEAVHAVSCTATGC